MRTSYSLLEGMVMIFHATSNNISVISWPSVLLVEKTTDLPEVTDNLSHNVVSSTPRLSGIRTLVVIGTDCIGGYKSNYHTITTAPIIVLVKIRSL